MHSDSIECEHPEDVGQLLFIREPSHYLIHHERLSSIASHASGVISRINTLQSHELPITTSRLRVVYILA